MRIIILWSRLTNPKYHLKAAFDPIRATWILLKEDEVSPPQSTVINGISTDDYRDMVREFLDSVPEIRRRQFSKVLDLPSFWRSWSNLIQLPNNTDLFKAWGKFRLERIRYLVYSRLRSSGLDEAQVDIAMDFLELSRRQSNKDSQTTDSSPKQEKKHNSIATKNDREKEIREVARKVLDSMTADQIYQLWIPFSAVADVLIN